MNEDANNIREELKKAVIGHIIELGDDKEFLDKLQVVINSLK